MGSYNIAVAGATGLVGQELLKVLEQRGFPVKSLKALASKKSMGKAVAFGGEDIPVEELAPGAFKGVDLAFFAVGTELSKEFVPQATSAGAVAIDKSNAFRMDPEVPLVVPEVNAHALHRHKGMIASPNCSTIQMVVALKPIHDYAHISRIVVSTYQSVSGTGREAMDELREQALAILEGRERPPATYPYRIAFNLLPHIDSFDKSGYTLEETKLLWESRKILEDDGLQVTATAVRVPVFVGHSEAVTFETERPIDAGRTRELLVRAPGVVLVDDPASSMYPMPIDCAGRDEVFVGRVRDDLFKPNCVSMWVVADNLRKGAATNAVQIAEALIERRLI